MVWVSFGIIFYVLEVDLISSPGLSHIETLNQKRLDEIVSNHAAVVSRHPTYERLIMFINR